MRRLNVLGAILLGVLAASPAAGQIVRGADQANQNKWNAKSPWGKTERSAPVAAQQKKPFKLFDNVWYVGFQTVSVYLVETSGGLVLIDSGYAQTVDWLLENIRTAGFDPANVEYIFITHSHVDHASGAARMKQITGARVGLSAEDWGAVELQQKNPQGSFPVAMQRDLVLTDNDAITLGDTTFMFYFTPGHTVGSTSVEFPVHHMGRTYRALTPGGLGLHYAPVWGPTFKTSIQRLRALGPWDVALGNHPFLSPVDLEIIEKRLAAGRQAAAHPAVVGPAAVTAFFDAILAIVDEKLVAEPPGAARR
jgi:metallo-beta-lactamase class B